MKIIEKDQIHSQKWNDLLLKFDEYNIFHTTYWLNVLKETYSYKPVFLRCICNSENVAILPLLLTGNKRNRKGISLPFSDFCPLLIKNSYNSEEIVLEVFQFLRKYRVKSLEIRGLSSHMKIHDENNIYIHHLLKLNNNPEQIFNNMKSYCRRNIRKASRLGIRTEQSSSMNSVKLYYNLHCITRKRLGTPPQPLSFFKNIKKYIFDNNHGFIILGYFNDIPIAGAVFFHFGEKALFKFGASDQRFQQMRANNLILWEAIYYFAINEFKELSLGRTSQGNIGLLNYKEGWGADRTKINYYTYPAIIQKSILIDHLIRISRKIITVLPVTILKTIVSRLYRFFP